MQTLTGFQKITINFVFWLLKLPIEHILYMCVEYSTLAIMQST